LGAGTSSDGTTIAEGTGTPTTGASTTGETNETRGELSLFRVATDGTPPAVVFTVPIADIGHEGTGGDGDFDRVIDLRGFGDQLAIGVLTRTPGSLAPRIRLLRIDTAQVAP